MTEPRQLLVRLFEAAVQAAHPAACLAPHLPPVKDGGRLIVLGAGKAAAAMAAVTERHYRERGQLDHISGCLTPPHGYGASLLETDRSGALCAHLERLEARHPTPDAASLVAAERALAIAASATGKDTVLVLLSGGASSLWAAPAGLDLATKTTLTRGLLKSGADIYQMNTVRRHLSRIKGGRLAAAASGAGHLLTLAISDVPGDDAATIGSGPTVPDPTTLSDARAVLAKLRPAMAALGLDVPEAVHRALADPANETPKPGDPAFSRADYRIIATPKKSLQEAAALAREAGYKVLDLGDALTGEARDVAAKHARLALEARQRGEKLAIISGGELEVTVKNRDGRGGRSQEYALAFALAIQNQNGISALAADTDGIDGGGGLVTDPAGAMVDFETVEKASARHLDAQLALDNNDATPFFEALGLTLVTGPTHTNVNDFRAILIDPQT